MINSSGQVDTVMVTPPLAVTPQAAVVVFVRRNSVQKSIDVGVAVGGGLGTRVGTTVGRAVGSTDGIGVGRAEGDCVGNADGAGVGGNVGKAVGENVTSCTPGTPEITARPKHSSFPTQPSRMMYVCVGVPAGTVYCTCAHRSVPEMHCTGGPAPLPVSSYTTSTPPGVYTRSVVWPVQKVPGKRAGHMDTVNV